MITPPRVVVVGAGLGGWRTATQLRELGHTGSLVVVGDESHRPYDRPPLSKQVLSGAMTPEAVQLDDAGTADALDIDLRLGERVTCVRPGEVQTSRGTIPWDALVLATGGVPRRPRFVPRHERVHVLRTLDDSVSLRAALLDAGTLVVVGGGFIGMEVAAAARGLGVDVAILEAQPALAETAIGAPVGGLLGELHRTNGVTVSTGVAVAAMTAHDTGVVVDLADGTSVAADVAVVGLGAAPDLRLVDGLGVDTADGLLCDAVGRVVGLPGAWAVGDVARWAMPDGSSVRHEHWSTTADRAGIVAHAVLGLAVPDFLRPPPYVWSDQYGVKLQLLGRPELADSEGWLETDGPSGAYGYRRGEHLVAVVTLGTPRLLAVHRRSVVDGLAAQAAASPR